MALRVNVKALPNRAESIDEGYSHGMGTLAFGDFLGGALRMT